MPTLYLLPSCKTCQRVHDQLADAADWTLRNIKEEPLTAAELDELAGRAGSYEALFSRRAQLYRQRNLKKQQLGEQDFRRLMLEHYTFLKRPVMDTGSGVFAGSAGKTLDAVRAALAE